MGILGKEQKLHLIAIVSRSLISTRSLHKPQKVEIVFVCLSICPYSVCFISETSGHISLGLSLTSAVQSDHLSERSSARYFGVRSMGGNTFFTTNFNPLKTKRRLLYLKTQFVPHSKNFSSPL